MGRRSFAVHRWLGAAIGLQLLLWSLGGFVFATHSIAWVRGDEGRRTDIPQSLSLDEVTVSPADAVVAAGISAPGKIVLRKLVDRTVYEIQGSETSKLVDAHNGEVITPISEQDAVQIARMDRMGSPGVRATHHLTNAPPSEYRGGELPAWRIELADSDNTAIYVSATTGQITARRNDAWRRFDFFWMLHTMDYSGRDNFNHPLLIGASAAAILSVLSGGLLWFLRIRRRRKRRRTRC